MAELVEVGADGKEHFLWIQETVDSCGPACVYMIQSILTRSCPVGGKAWIRMVARLLPQGYRDGAGTQDISALAVALRGVGIGARAAFTGNFASHVANARFPFIARIQWSDPNGGHFVVCAGRTRTGRLTCLDPWFGLFEPTLPGLPQYRPQIDARSRMTLVRARDGRFSGHAVLLT